MLTSKLFNIFSQFNAGISLDILISSSSNILDCVTATDKVKIIKLLHFILIFYVSVHKTIAEVYIRLYCSTFQDELTELGLDFGGFIGPENW